MFMLVQGTESPAKTYQPEKMPKSAPKTQALCRGCDLRFTNIGSHAQWAQVRIKYTNPDKVSRFAELRVNGRIATRISFPSTGLNPGVIAIQALLDRQGETNTLIFSAEHDPGPTIDSITVK